MIQAKRHQLKEILNKSSHIFWDWNGTILNDAPLCWELVNEAISRINLAPLTFEQYQEYYEHPIIRMYERMGVDLKTNSFAEMATYWHVAYQERVMTAALHDGMSEVLTLFHNQNKVQHILSALPQKLLDHAVDERMLRGFFTGVFGSTDGSTEKIEGGKNLLRSLSADPETVVVIGDSVHDAEVARELRCSCILIAGGSDSLRKLKNTEFPVLESVKSLL